MLVTFGDFWWLCMAWLLPSYHLLSLFQPHWPPDIPQQHEHSSLPGPCVHARPTASHAGLRKRVLSTSTPPPKTAEWRRIHQLLLQLRAHRAQQSSRVLENIRLRRSKKWHVKHSVEAHAFGKIAFPAPAFQCTTHRDLFSPPWAQVLLQ